MIAVLRKVVLSVFLAGVFFLLEGMTPFSRGKLRELPPDQFEWEIIAHQEAMVLDAQTKEGFQEHHIEKAHSIADRAHLFAILDTLDRETPLFFYCEFGNRSWTAVKLAKKRKFKNLYYLDGGLYKWKLHGFPVEMEMGEE